MFYFIMGFGIGAHLHGGHYGWVSLLLFLTFLGYLEDKHNERHR